MLLFNELNKDVTNIILSYFNIPSDIKTLLSAMLVSRKWRLYFTKLYTERLNIIYPVDKLLYSKYLDKYIFFPYNSENKLQIYYRYRLLRLTHKKINHYQLILAPMEHKHRILKIRLNKTHKICNNKLSDNLSDNSIEIQNILLKEIKYTNKIEKRLFKIEKRIKCCSNIIDKFLKIKKQLLLLLSLRSNTELKYIFGRFLFI